RGEESRQQRGGGQSGQDRGAGDGDDRAGGDGQDGGHGRDEQQGPALVDGGGEVDDRGQSCAAGEVDGQDVGEGDRDGGEGGQAPQGGGDPGGAQPTVAVGRHDPAARGVAAGDEERRGREQTDGGDGQAVGDHADEA